VLDQLTFKHAAWWKLSHFGFGMTLRAGATEYSPKESRQVTSEIGRRFGLSIVCRLPRPDPRTILHHDLVALVVPPAMSQPRRSGTTVGVRTPTPRHRPEVVHVHGGLSDRCSAGPARAPGWASRPCLTAPPRDSPVDSKCHRIGAFDPAPPSVQVRLIYPARAVSKPRHDATTVPMRGRPCVAPRHPRATTSLVVIAGTGTCELKSHSGVVPRHVGSPPASPAVEITS